MAYMPPAARRAPKNAFSPASICPPLAQIGFPAMSPVSAPVAPASANAKNGPIGMTAAPSAAMAPAATSAPTMAPIRRPTKSLFNMCPPA